MLTFQGARAIQRMELWTAVYVATINSTGQWTTAQVNTDKALKDFDKAFPLDKYTMNQISNGNLDYKAVITRN